MWTDPISLAVGATVLTWVCTAIGAAGVFITPRFSRSMLSALLALSAGVMVVAGVGSLWIPAVTLFAGGPLPGWFTASAVAAFGGAATLWARRALAGHDPATGRRKLGPLMLATMSAHHVPEGMAVGLAVAAAGAGMPAAGAIGLVVAMAGHNVLEGMVVSVPLREEGASRTRSFLLGQFSGLFEVAGGAIGASAVAFSATALPYGLALAAGAMVVVALGDVLPSARRLGTATVVAPAITVGMLAMFLLQRVGA